VSQGTRPASPGLETKNCDIKGSKGPAVDLNAYGLGTSAPIQPPNMATENSIGDLLASGDEPFSVIERLADAIRSEDDVRISDKDRQRLVQDLYEGPKQCACCVGGARHL